MQENQNNQQNSWIYWQVPAHLAGDYIFKLFIFLFLLPWFIGIQFTLFGWATNVLLIDFIMYLGYKHRGLL